MEYILQPGNKRFDLNYRELRTLYIQYSTLSDDDFTKQLPNIIHFACIAGYLKELTREETISDIGIIHQLIHLLSNTDGQDVILSTIRNNFNELLKLY